ncbi:class I adenylate-forming enzyme family protein [Nocardia takedensis]|uniref:class I adenylate-forming enzyme family protein n=1 Tax=Nocardia takedensis TaxID=259390 RepID=UPI0002FBC88E|nr:AMP-binding protein [Nocardia takedensis]
MSGWSGSTALVFEDRSYARTELDDLAAGLAADLAVRGVGPGDRVALMSSNRPEFVIATLAIWRLGAAVVLISPAWKVAEVAHALALTSPRYGVGDCAVLGELLPTRSLDEPIAPKADDPGVFSVGGGPNVFSVGGPPAAGPRGTDPAADAVLVFSSGTTGMPKAVRHTHASLEAAVEQWREVLGLDGSDRLQIATPPSHILGLLNILTALRVGAGMRLHRRFDLKTMLDCIQNERITVEMAVAPIALALASHPDLESYDLSSLRYIMWGATPVTASVAETVTRRTGVGWLPAYGASELPVIACNPRAEPRLDSVGRAAPGVRIRVVSVDSGEVVGTGETGEIQCRADSLMSGYLPSEATASAFHDGWYRTGDVGHVDAEGWIRLTDRLKEMIKVRGFQVAPAEIEAVLHGHPDIQDCAVFGVDGADGEAIVAAVRTDGDLTEDQVVAFVGDRLATYKKPRRVVFVPEIPRLPSGKVLRRVLKERHGHPSDQ